MKKDLSFQYALLLFQAKTLAEPFAYDDYRRKKIAQKIEEARKNRVQVKVRFFSPKCYFCQSLTVEMYFYHYSIFFLF